MKRSNSLALAFATLAISFATGCSVSSTGAAAAPKSADHANANASASASAPSDVAAEADDAEEAKAATVDGDGEAKAPVVASPRKAREVGDFVVFRFSGSYRKAPVTLTERVIAKGEGTVTLEVSLADERDDGSADEASRTYRVMVDATPAKAGEIKKVTRLVKGKERAEKREAYEAFIAQTTLAADSNEGVLATEKTTIEVSGVKIACEKSSFRVRVGKKTATLSTLVSDAFAWNDVGGEMKAEDGSVLYKAELVKVGKGGAKSAKSAQKADAKSEVASVYED